MSVAQPFRLPNDFDMGRYPEHDTCENVRELQRKNLLRPGLHFILPTENFVAGALQGFTGRATCSPATAGAAMAGTDQASPGRRHDISINSISAAPAQ